MNKISGVEVVRKLAFKLSATFRENVDSGYFSFDNEKGKGSIRSTKIFFGLEVLSFDVVLFHPLIFNYLNLGDVYLHCIFIDEGYLEHSFKHSENGKNASRFQNVIVGSTSEDFSSIKLPTNVKLKFLVITLEKCERSLNYRGKLQVLLGDVLKRLSVDKSFSYFGNFSSKASRYVDTVINTAPKNLNNRLLIEASVLNILSCQFLDHEKDISGETVNSDLTKSEIINVIRTSEYIAQNLDSPLKLTELERECGLHQKRIQKGFQHFFGMSVNKYIVNLRILKAKELIEKTDLSISEIVYKIGLNSRSYFSKIFSNKYGLLPNEYRKNFNIYNPTYELSYYSEAQNDLLKSDFDNILNESRKRNLEHKVTGCLIYHKSNFFQILEGPKDAVQKIYEKIKGDQRHSSVVQIYDGLKSGRTFDEWNMAFLEKSSLFIDHNLCEFKMMNTELVLEVDKKKPKDKANKLRTKLMWERARNALLLFQEEKI